MRSAVGTSNGEAPAGADALRVLAGALEEHLRGKGLDEEAVRDIVDQKIAEAKLPRPVEVKLPTGDTVRLEGRVHTQFDELLALVNEGHVNLLMVGPAGSGKTTLAKSLAQSLNRDFALLSLSGGITESHLFGRMLPQADGSWKYEPSRFVQVYEQGGVFLLDEIDAADANVMVSVNAALANGVLANPINGQLHKRHPDTLIIAAANTYGRGGDQMYVGRNQLDSATLDRFVLSTLFVNYDRELERSMTADLGDSDELIAWVESLRTGIAEKRLRRIASTRLVEQAASALRAGRRLDEVKGRYFQSWSADEKAKVHV
jgi:MoxR-like ATPase